MLNFFALTTEADRKEAAAIERRRVFDQERMKRIFNPKSRRYGIDSEALSQQVKEKKKREEDERLVDQAYYDQFIKNDSICIALEKKEQQERLKCLQEVNKFRRCCQRPEDRREFDLNDPNRMKKMVPIRVGIDDPRLGVSAAQKFEGEDANGVERTLLQREQAKAWLGQQRRAKEAAEKERKAADEAYLLSEKARDDRALELEAMDRECRRRIEEAYHKFNRAMADEKRAQEKKRAQMENADSMAEMFNFMTSDMLTENREVAYSNLHPGRQIGYLYKGMTPEEQQAVYDYQKMQVEEKEKLRELEARHEREMDAYTNATQQTIAQMDMELDRQKRVRDKELAMENKALAQEQKLRQKYLNQVVYGSNNPSEEFYAQFNKSGR